MTEWQNDIKMPYHRPRAPEVLKAFAAHIVPTWLHAFQTKAPQLLFFETIEFYQKVFVSVIYFDQQKPMRLLFGFLYLFFIMGDF